MSQHDYDIANAAGASFRADLNNALLASVSQNSGATAPTTTFAYQLWADTTSGWLKQRDAANAAWIKRWPLGTATRTDIASAATLDLTANAVNSDYLRITGTTTVTVAGAGVAETVGLLENWLATNYGSVGVIHMTRQAAVIGLAREVLVTSGGRLTTQLGTPVAAGSGYPGTGPAGQAAAASTSWIFATPALFGYRSEVFDSSDRSGDLFDRSLNNLYAVAERSFLLGFDPCGVAAALATLTAF